jgi:hypothetical protein
VAASRYSAAARAGGMIVSLITHETLWTDPDDCARSLIAHGVA